MIADQQERIKELHRLYAILTSLDVPLTLGRIYQWEVWLMRGFNEDDLRLVIEFHRRKIRDRRKTMSCLKFSWLIAQIEYFQEDLAEARALARKPVVDAGRAQALRSTGRPCDTPQAKVRTAGEVLRGNEALKELLRLRDSL